MRRLAFDARTIGDHYPGIGRYGYGIWQALGERISYTIVDPNLPNTRFKISGRTCNSYSVRSPLSQIDLPFKLGEADIYYSPYFLIPYLSPRKCVLTLYDTIPLYGNQVNALNKIIFRCTHLLAGRRAQQIIILSESAKHDLAALGVPPQKMKVCYVGLDKKFSPQPADEVTRVKKKYNLPSKFWLCFGSKRWHKNTAAAKELRLKIKEQTLIIIGEEIPLIDENDLAAVYSAAQALIFPSLREGFGLPIIEAMACGTPVVCLPTPGVKEAAGNAAVMAEEITTGSLVEAASRLTDPNLREEKKIAGFEWVKQFTWDKTVEAICDL